MGKQEGSCRSQCRRAQFCGSGESRCSRAAACPTARRGDLWQRRHLHATPSTPLPSFPFNCGWICPGGRRAFERLVLNASFAASFVSSLQGHFAAQDGDGGVGDGHGFPAIGSWCHQRPGGVAPAPGPELHCQGKGPLPAPSKGAMTEPTQCMAGRAPVLSISQHLHQGHASWPASMAGDPPCPVLLCPLPAGLGLASNSWDSPRVMQRFENSSFTMTAKYFQQPKPPSLEDRSERSVENESSQEPEENLATRGWQGTRGCHRPQGWQGESKMCPSPGPGVNEPSTLTPPREDVK